MNWKNYFTADQLAILDQSYGIRSAEDLADVTKSSNPEIPEGIGMEQDTFRGIFKTVRQKFGK